MIPYLEFDLGLCNVLFTSTSTCDLLCFGNLRFHGLLAKIFQWIPFDGIYTQNRIRLDDGEPSRDCVHRSALLGRLVDQGSPYGNTVCSRHFPQ